MQTEQIMKQTTKNTMNAMKTIVKRLIGTAAVVAALVGVQCTAAAQEIELTFGQQNKTLAKHFAPQLLGSDGTSVVYVMTKGVVAPSKELVSFDMQQKEQAAVKLCKVKLNGTYDINVERAFVNGSEIDLLVSNTRDNGLVVTHERRTMATLELQGEARTLVNMSGTKEDGLFFFSAVSPNGKLLATATAKVEAGIGAEVRVGLYSDKVEEYWSMEVPAHGFSDMMVSNDGEVVLVGMQEKDGRGTVQVTVADGEKSDYQSFGYTTNGVLKEWAPAFYKDGRVVLVAAMQSDYKTLMRVGPNIDCIDAVSCQMASGEVSVDRHSFGEAELARMENKKGNTTGYRWMEMGNLQQVIGDEEGAFAVVDNQWDTYNQYGWVSRERRGMMVLRIGSDGRFKWTHTERTYTYAPAGLRDMIRYRWTATADGIMLAWTTNSKDAAKGTDEKVKGSKLYIGSSELTVMTLDREGQTKKASFSLGGLALHLYPTPLDKGEWLLLATGKTKGKFGKLRIVN